MVDADRGLLMRSRQMLFETDRRIVEKDAAAALAEHHFFGVAELLKELRAQQNLAGGTASGDSLGDSRTTAPLLSDALVGGIGGLRERGYQLLAFGLELEARNRLERRYSAEVWAPQVGEILRAAVKDPAQC
jgi:hypothetical protein